MQGEVGLQRPLQQGFGAAKDRTNDFQLVKNKILMYSDNSRR